ncbi:MAG: radical SAM/SPASM domain-containing protein [Deltaproteobacteria bacterium]|jgi:MoaA/NifB/PqqE/SkfB family radical SAM enzyme|nr:radical SAM/SPASM domain-containing protein [Deltaproteobacteria bacterium]
MTGALNLLPPDETGLEKICLFPEKLVSLNLNRTGADPLYPVSVELSLTSRCNLRCIWCSELALRDRSPDLLTLGILENLFTELKQGGTRGVTIEGGGEPTLAPFFAEAAQKAVDLGLQVGLISNGLNLFSLQTPESFYSIFQWIRISLDASDRSDFASLKGRDGYDSVLANLASLASLKGPTIGVGYVLTNRNDDPHKLLALGQKLKEMKIAYFHLRPVVDHPALASNLNLNFLNTLNSPHFAVNMASMTHNRISGNDGLPCLAHSLATVITADGAVWLCGRLGHDPQAEPLGYLTRETFRTLWHGRTRISQTAMAASGDFCRGHCPPCRMTKYNRLLARLALIRTRDFI